MSSSPSINRSWPEKYRTSPQVGLFLGNINVDSFAGGGGASTGIEWALGRPVDVAINHDSDAIDMHTLNHPHTTHYCESVWDVDPREVTKGLPVGLAFFSPDCRHFSIAKGNVPVEKAIRGLAWVSLRWAATVKPKVIILENVKEFRTWGPVVKGKPCKKRKGNTFRSFINALKKHGYQVDHRIITASDLGAPTKRERFFLIARCDGLPISWPEITHGNPQQLNFKESGLKAWVAAGEAVINWELPCPSIFNRKKPLVPKSITRIAKGIEREVLNSNHHFILPIAKTGCKKRVGHESHSHSVRMMLSNELNRTAPTDSVSISSIPDRAITASYLIKYRGTNLGSSLFEPVPTITAGGLHLGLVRLVLIKKRRIGNEEHSSCLPIDQVVIDGWVYAIIDIGLRMLTPAELYAAQGFPSNYQFEYRSDGTKRTIKDQVARCGNSVVPVVAKAIVSANIFENKSELKAA